MASDEEEDYMTMVFEDNTKPTQETSLQRRARKQREGEIKARNKSKAEKEAEEAAAREAALATAMDTSNKGFKMMAKFGFKAGDTLGTSENARKEPIHLNLKEDKGGIGLDTEKKRKFREEMETQQKKVKANEDEYLDRIRSDREAKRKEAQFYSAQKTAERLDTNAMDRSPSQQQLKQSLVPSEAGMEAEPFNLSQKPLKEVNVLWRGLVRHRMEKERDAKLKRGLTERTSLPSYQDEEEDELDKLALGKNETLEIVEDELDEEDPELTEFDQLPFADRLEKIVAYMRGRHHYCFWCKYQYPDASMDGCPGITEEDHD